MFKEDLLQTGYFEDNNYFKLYLQLIEANKNTKVEKFRTQAHHIVPRHYYTQNNLDIDNSKVNIINLLYKDHMLAHMYLSGCSKGRNKYWNLYAVFRLAGKDYISFEELQNELDDYQQLYEAAIKSDYNHRKGMHVSNKTRKKMQTAQKLHFLLKGEANNKGYKWVHNNIKDYMVPVEELDEYLNEGFILGRLYRHSENSKAKIGAGSRSWKRSEEFCKKMSIIASNQVHTEEQNKRQSAWAKEHFVGAGNPFYGKKHSEATKEINRQKHKGKKYINNGIIEKMIEPNQIEQYLAEGWKLGYLRKRNQYDT